MSATAMANAVEIVPSAEVVNAILKWSIEDRRDLAILLQDSIREGFTSLAEAENGKTNLIHERTAELVNGAETRDVSELLAAIDRGVAEARKR